MPGKTFLNTSPIQYIHQVGLLPILGDLFGKVYVPAEVLDEINQGRQEGIELPDLEQISCIEILGPMANHFSQLVRDLGKGETAVILHGLKHRGALVVLDDLLARRVAKQMELCLTGTAGILIAAKMKGLITSIEPSLTQMESLGFHLAPAHRAIILKQAGEK